MPRVRPVHIAVAIAAILAIAALYAGWHALSVKQKLSEAEKRLKQTQEQLLRVKQQLEEQKKVVQQAQEEIRRLKKPYELIAQIPLRSRSEVIRDHKYADTSKWMLSTYTALLFTPDGRYLLVADYKNRVYCVETATGKVLWTKEFPERMGYSMAVSRDGRYVYVGFRSLEGELTCMEVATGKVVWEWKASSDIGPGSPKYYSWYWPTVFSISVSPDGKYVYVAARRMARENGTRVNYARVYCLDASTGKVLWKFPRSCFVDSCIPHAVLSPDGRYYAFQTWWYGKKWGPYKVCVLNASTGEPLYVLDVNKTVAKLFPKNPVRPATAWHGIDFSPDSSELAVVARNGIILLVDNRRSAEEGKPVIAKYLEFSTPLLADVVAKEGKVAKAYIYAYTGYVKWVGDYVFVFSSNTYALGVWGGRPALDHPNASKVFVFTPDLRLEWMYDMGGKVGYGFNFIGWSADGRIVAVPIGQNWIKMSNDPSGVVVFDMSRSGTVYDKVVFRYHTEGTAIAAAVSPDGRYVAVVELPINVAPPGSPLKVVGEYRVLLFKVNV